MAVFNISFFSYINIFATRKKKSCPRTSGSSNHRNQQLALGLDIMTNWQTCRLSFRALVFLVADFLNKKNLIVPKKVSKTKTIFKNSFISWTVILSQWNVITNTVSLLNTAQVAQTRTICFVCQEQSFSQQCISEPFLDHIVTFLMEKNLREHILNFRAAWFDYNVTGKKWLIAF